MANSTEQANVKVNLDGKAAGEELGKLKTQAAALRQEMNKLKEANDLAGFEKKKKELADVTSAMKQLQKQTFDVTVVLKNLNGSSLADLQKAQRLLTNELKFMTRGTEEFVEKSKQLQQVTKEVDKVKDGMKGVGTSLDSIPGPVGNVVGSVKGLINVFMMLVANPIVLGIAAIGTAVYALGSALKDTDEGGKKFDAFIKVYTTTLDVFRQRLANVANGLLDIANGERQEGLKKLGTSFEGISHQIGMAAEAAKEYIYQLDAIGDAEINLISAHAEVNKRIAELQYNAADKSLTKELRKQALIDAKVLGENLLQEEMMIADKKYQTEVEFQAKKLGISDKALKRLIEADDAGAQELLSKYKWLADARDKLNDEGQKKLEELYAAKVNLETNFFHEFKRNNSKIAQLDDEINTKQEKIAEDKKKKTDEEIKLSIEFQKKLKELIQERIQINVDENVKEIMQVNKKYDDLLEAAKGHSTDLFEIEAQRALAISALQDAQAKKIADKSAAESEKLMAKYQTEYEKYLNERSALEKKYFTADAEDKQALEIAELQTGLDKQLITIEEFEIGKANIEKKYRDKKEKDEEALQKKLDAFWEESTQKILSQIFDISNQNRQDELDAKLSSLEAQKEVELSNANLTESEKNAINNKYRKQEAAEKLKAWKADQAAAIIQAEINGIMTALKTYAEFGYPWGIAAALASEVVTQMQVAAIANKKPPQFWKGKYPITGADDGRTYNADIAPMKNGLYSRPTALVGERGPELVFDADATRMIQVNYPGLIEAAKMKQYSGGKYQDTSIKTQDRGNGMVMVDKEVVMAMRESIERLNGHLDKGLKTKFSLYDFKKEQDKVNKNEGDFSMFSS